MAIEIDSNFMVVRCAESGNESRTFTPHQWGALMTLLKIDDRIVTFDDLANAIYTDQDLAHDGVSDQALHAVINRVRRRIRDVSDLDHVLTYRGWGWRLSLEGKKRTAVVRRRREKV